MARISMVDSFVFRMASQCQLCQWLEFDYIVHDCRACGLGCNFQPERLMETMQVIDNEIRYRAKDC
ncbi:hypothetical protein Ahy_B08g093281 isoform C [Arachis hypogaea]|uniref:Uncharacterized protein n=1 Tax=Arachis hypogaea TaxID=3818 RepID=A0A444Y5R2_ARAHY|nr:hypothetical protein Ahy_B08g093281 isoform C [Arachis hypogaea]